MKSLRAVSLLLPLVLVGCATTGTPSPEFVYLKVQWAQTSKSADAMCKEQMPDLRKKSKTYNGCASRTGKACSIIATMPSGWKDRKRLEIMGHELWHCLGQKHE